MKFLRQNLPMLLVAIFEFGVGIMIILDKGKNLTQTVFIVLGVILALVSIVYFIRFFKDKKNGDVNVFTISAAIFLVVIGLLCAIFSKSVSEHPIAVTIIYGGILIAAGIFKIQSYVDAKKTGIPLSFLTLVSAGISAAGGILALIDPFKKAEETGVPDGLMIFIGVILVVVAAIDVVAVFYNPNKKSKAVVPVDENKEN